MFDYSHDYISLCATAFFKILIFFVYNHLFSLIWDQILLILLNMNNFYTDFFNP